MRKLAGGGKVDKHKSQDSEVSILILSSWLLVETPPPKSAPDVYSRCSINASNELTPRDAVGLQAMICKKLLGGLAVDSHKDRGPVREWASGCFLPGPKEPVSIRGWGTWCCGEV
jgi:hypothetical protein